MTDEKNVDCESIWGASKDGVSSSPDTNNEEISGYEIDTAAGGFLLFIQLLILGLSLDFLAVSSSGSVSNQDSIAVNIIQIILVIVGAVLIRSVGVRYPRAWTDKLAESILNFFDKFEDAQESRVYRFDIENENIRESFRRMFNFRSRWITLAIVCLSSIIIEIISPYPSVSAETLGQTLNFFGALALTVSAIRGPAGIGRDTTGLLTPSDISNDHNPRKEQYCERLLSISANAIDGIVGFFTISLGFLIVIIY